MSQNSPQQQQQKQSIIHLDVEGVYFKTRISTLSSIEGTFFSKLFQTNWKELLNREGKYFIDRDSSVFPVILNFLRDHEKCPLPKDEYQLEKILREAVYFNIGPLRKLVEQKLRLSSPSICTCPPEIPTTPVPSQQKEYSTTISRKNGLKPPPPPPPPPPPLPQLLNPVQIPMRKTQLEKNLKKLKKTSAQNISLPLNFTHLAHVGWNGSSLLFDNKSTDGETVRKICDAAAEAVDMNAVYSVVNKNSNDEDESVEVLITGGVIKSK